MWVGGFQTFFGLQGPSIPLAGPRFPLLGALFIVYRFETLTASKSIGLGRT